MLRFDPRNPDLCCPLHSTKAWGHVSIFLNFKTVFHVKDLINWYWLNGVNFHNFLNWSVGHYLWMGSSEMIAGTLITLTCRASLVSLSNESMKVIAGHPVDRLPCVWSQRSSCETISFLLFQQHPLNFNLRVWRVFEIGGRPKLIIEY